MECIDIADDCRACQTKIQEESQKIFIFNTMKLPDIFKETTSLDIYENDGLPKVLCPTCYDRLLEAFNFKKMCSAAVLHFQSMLSMDDYSEEKYILPENLICDINLTDTIQTDIKIDPDLDLKDDQNHLPDKDDSVSDISDKISIDEKLPEIPKINPDNDALLISRNLRNTRNRGSSNVRKSTKFECGSCNSNPNQKSHLKIQIRKKHPGSKTFECKTCGKKFQSTSSLRRHLNTYEVNKGHESQKDTKEHICVVCGIANETRHELKSHTKTHKKDDNWFCVFCSYKSTRFLYLKHHINVLHKGIKDYHCSQCEKSFTTAPSLRDHMLRHADIKNHVCTVCGVKKVTRTELRKHMIIHSEKMLSCEFCPLKFLRGDSLKQHIRIVHQEIKEHYCTICNKTFAISRTLKNHLMIHTGEKPHACTKCPKRFIRLDQLKLHMKLHTGKDTFSCESCSFKTNYLHDLKNHVNVVHEGVKDNYCDSCKKSFPTASSLRDHLLTHTGEKPHKCSECGKRFSKRSNLIRHLKTNPHLKSKSEGKYPKSDKSKMGCIDIADDCRACQTKTQEESQKIFIFNTVKLPDIFKETTSLDIHENDGLPKVLCSTCYDRLLEAYNFKKMCSAAALHFQKILSMGVPEVTAPEDVTDTILMDIKTEPDSDVSDSDDASSDISDLLSVDEKLLEVIKPDPDGDAFLISQVKEDDYSGTKKDLIIPEEPIKLECGICNSSFHQKSRLEMHIRKKHLGLKPCECKICGKEFKSSSSLNKHLNTHEVTEGFAGQEDTNRHTCVVCGVKNETEDQLKSHIYTHKKDNDWTCIFCPFKTVKRYSLLRHVKVVHKGLKEFHCSQCDRSFTTAVSLRNHMMRHEGIKNHVCTVCGVKKVTRASLQNHMIIHAKDKRIWSCELCPFKFNRRENLNQHVKRIHHGIKNHHCTLCNKSFGHPSGLKYHLMVHTGERPHACSKCNKRFIRLDRLKMHMKLHTGEDILSCEFCSFKASCNYQIRRHVRTVHEGVKDYHCAQCNRSFVTTTSLRHHQLTHTGEKPHTCNECGMKFTILSNLRRHMKTHLHSKFKSETKIKTEENLKSTLEQSGNLNT
ncbi:zinc finger protein 62-like [Phlebotomus papatasi]|uniref:zinc finger protein 62-like n=1 Tax=Phlebotomus papatasi TaxID=29031 RepID=UPI0024841B98|nr:zinc finger protein 62-like [Phlebotomus papatasi]